MVQSKGVQGHGRHLSFSGCSGAEKYLGVPVGAARMLHRMLQNGSTINDKRYKYSIGCIDIDQNPQRPQQ
jgi:hypothetical protein